MESKYINDEIALCDYPDHLLHGKKMLAHELIEKLQEQIDAGNGFCDLLVCFSDLEHPVEIERVEFSPITGIVLITE